MKKIFLASLISLFLGGLIGWFLSGFGKDISSFVFREKYPDAPLGLKWGMTAAELESKAGAVLCPERFDENVPIYSLKSPPIPLPGITEYLVFVHNDYGAMKILMIEEFKSDEDGTKGKEEYFKYKKSLSNKYGKPTDSIESVEKDNDEFYQCLDSVECGYYVTFFGDHLSIQLDGISRGRGNLNIVYESELFIKHDEDRENKIQNGL